MTAMLDDVGCPSPSVMIWLVLLHFVASFRRHGVGEWRRPRCCPGASEWPWCGCQWCLDTSWHHTSETQILWSSVVTPAHFQSSSWDFKMLNSQGPILFILGSEGWASECIRRCRRQPHFSQIFEIYQHTKTSLDHFWYFQAKLQRFQPKIVTPNGLKLSAYCWISRWDSAATRGRAWHQGR